MRKILFATVLAAAFLAPWAVFAATTTGVLTLTVQQVALLKATPLQAVNIELIEEQLKIIREAIPNFNDKTVKLKFANIYDGNKVRFHVKRTRSSMHISWETHEIMV